MNVDEKVSVVFDECWIAGDMENEELRPLEVRIRSLKRSFEEDSVVSICVVHWEVVLDLIRSSSTCWRNHNESFAEQAHCSSNFT